MHDNEKVSAALARKGESLRVPKPILQVRAAMGVVDMWRTACLVFLTGLMVASGSVFAQNSAGMGGVQPDGPVVRDPNYRLAPDDVLQLTVWGEPAIQGVYLTVTPEGVVVAPVVGSIRAAGRTVEEVKADIARRFIEMDYLKNPTVQLTLYQVHRMRVRVLGQVYRPGLQQMRDGDTVAHAIAEAGSFIPDTAALRKATITRPGLNEPIPVNLEAFYFEGDMSQDIPLKDGDTIYIPEDTESRIYVMGMVQRPGQFPWKKTTTVTQAISQAGGPIERGALGRTVIVRRAAEGQEPQQIPVNVAELLDKGDTSKDILLQPGDVVLVRETRRPNLTTVSQVLSNLYQVVFIAKWGL